MNEAIQPKRRKAYSLIRWIIICGATLIIALLIGAIPMLISYRKVIGT
jgi:hypothetical protein